MHGCRRLLIVPIMVLLASGCADDGLPLPTPPEPHHPEAAAGSNFDRTDTGTLEGKVSWVGPTADVPPFLVFSSPDNIPLDGRLLTRQPNPFLPSVDPQTGGVADAVVFLRGIDPRRARAWHHGPVQVEQSERRMFVLQDGHAGRVGL